MLKVSKHSKTEDRGEFEWEESVFVVEPGWIHWTSVESTELISLIQYCVFQFKGTDIKAANPKIYPLKG